MHWVMHKCIMFKVGGGKYTESMFKVGEFSENRWGNICESSGEIIIFDNQWGKCTKTGKIGGKFKNLWSMTKKKVIRNFGG